MKKKTKGKRRSEGKKGGRGKRARFVLQDDDSRHRGSSWKHRKNRKWKNAEFIDWLAKIAYVRARAWLLARLGAGETHLSPFSRRLNTCDNARQRRSTSPWLTFSKAALPMHRPVVACHLQHHCVALNARSMLICTMESGLEELFINSFSTGHFSLNTR